MKISRYPCVRVSVTHPLVGKHLAPYTSFAWKLKVKFTLVEATKAQRRSIIALLFL